MEQAARSIYIYALYLVGLGATLLFLPNIPLPIFGVAETHEVWIHVVGWTVLVLAVFYFMSARHPVRETIALSVWIRLAVPLVFAAFVLAGLAPWTLVLLTTGDVLFAAWTWVALQRTPALAFTSPRDLAR